MMTNVTTATTHGAARSRVMEEFFFLLVWKTKFDTKPAARFVCVMKSSNAGRKYVRYSSPDQR